MSQARPIVINEEPWFFRRYQFHARKLVCHRATKRRYRDFLEQALEKEIQPYEASILQTGWDPEFLPGMFFWAKHF